jgi:hypothetical protein
MSFTPPPFTSAQLPPDPSPPQQVSSQPSHDADPPSPAAETEPDASPSEETIRIAEHVEQRLLELFKRLPEAHPIFGEPAQDLVRLPMNSRRSNGQCWSHWCTKLGASVAREMGSRVPSGTCWMSRTTVVEIFATTGAHTRACLRKITTVRLLAFLQQPSDDNWTKLCSLPSDPAGSRPIDTPFSHRCSNGSQAAGAMGCINGLDHGRFATRAENESHKRCANGALALCPGHGVPPVRCIFVHATGLLRPCRNVEGHVPACQCAVRCYP